MLDFLYIQQPLRTHLVRLLPGTNVHTSYDPALDYKWISQITVMQWHPGVFLSVDTMFSAPNLKECALL